MQGNEGGYNSKYKTGEDIENRLDKNYYLDIQKAGFSGTKEEFDSMFKNGVLFITPTLESAPTNATTTYQDGDVTRSFVIGQGCRVYDSAASSYVIYQLYDLSDGVATWKKANEGGGIGSLSETVNITLTTNQAQPDASINGAVIHVLYGDNDTSLTWNGTPLSINIPVNMTFRIVYPKVEGYHTPDAEEYIAIAGNTRNVSAAYNTCVMSINVTSNQTDKSDINNVKATLSGSIDKQITYTGTALQVKVPLGESVSVQVSDVNGYNTPTKVTKTPTLSTDTVAFNYTTEKVTINVSTDDSADVSGRTLSVVNVNNSASLYNGAAGAGIVIKIPFGIKYKVSVNDYTMYITPDAKEFTSGEATREVSIVYEKIKSSQIDFDKSIAAVSNITGDINKDIISQILFGVRRCLCKKEAEGKVAICYLNDNNSNSYAADGTAAILTGNQGDVMVFKPDFYYKFVSLGGTKFAYRFSFFNIDGTWIHSPASLIGAYKGYVNGSKLYSRSGVVPTVNTSFDNFSTYAKARGAGYQQIDFEQHCMIALLFYAKYGTRNSQAVLGVGGAMYDSNNTTGSTNSIGNQDTVNETANYVNFLGIEGVHGCVFEWVEGVDINDYVWTITDPETKATRTVTAYNSDGWIKNIKAEDGPYFDVVPTAVGGSETTYYSDYYYRNTGRRVLARSVYSANTNGGVSSSVAGSDSAHTDASRGARLAFRGDIREVTNVSEFKALSVL